MMGSALSGMLKALSHEAPELTVTTHSESLTSSNQQLLISTSQTPSAKPHDVFGIMISDGIEFAPRLLPIPVNPERYELNSSSKSSFCGGYHLITGGSGFLGAQVASWLANAHCDGILLASRSGKFDLSAIEKGPIDDSTVITAFKADISALSDVCVTLPRNMAGVFHAGGVLADATLENQSLYGLRKVGYPVCIIRCRWKLFCKP